MAGSDGKSGGARRVRARPPQLKAARVRFDSGINNRYAIIPGGNGKSRKLRGVSSISGVPLILSPTMTPEEIPAGMVFQEKSYYQAAVARCALAD